MAGCTECGLPGYSDPKLCPVCTSPAPAHEAYLHDFTAKLGPIKLDPVSDRLRAKVVSEALDAVSREAFNTSIQRSRLWHAVAQAPIEELLMLRRLLK